MLGQDNNFYLISLSILITRLLDNVWIFIIIRRSYMLITSGSLRVKIVINIVNVIASGFVYKLLYILIADLTLSFPGVTRTEFLITISIQYLTDK